MALSQSALSELLEAFRTGDGVDMIRESVRTVLQELVEFEAAGVIGAERYERTEDRVTERNGTRPKLLATKAGDVQVRIPKLRKGSFFPSILEPRRRIDQALYAVVMEAYVHGVSTRSVDDLVVALGADSGISKSEVSRICEQLDESVGAFRTRPLDHIAFPYVYLDATYLHVRNKPGKGGQVVSMAVVVATGIAADGSREVLGLDVGDSEDETFWRAFLLSLKQRGPVRGEAGHLRPALRTREGAETVLPGLRPPAVSGSLRPQPPGPRPQVPRRHGRRGVPHHLRPTRRRGRQQRLGRDPRPARQVVPQG
jgi:transposase-like protein